MRNEFGFAALLALASTAPAYADVVISAGATENITCSGGICTPTATDAVLNTGDLEALLASGSVSVVTTNGSIQANNIDITAAISWSIASNLTFDAYQSITFSADVQNDSTGNVSLVTNDGGSGGALTFAIGSGKLDTNAVSINGESYKMAASVKQLVEMIVARRGGHFALSKDTDAGKDGVYYNSPIPQPFDGDLDGLGHTISNLEIANVSSSYVGLFSELKKRGSIASLTLRNAVVRGANSLSGLLVGINHGKVRNAFTSGRVRAVVAGGLVGDNQGSISTSQSAASVHANDAAGGLAGYNFGKIELSFATGAILGDRVGGVMGFQNAEKNGVAVENCYALGDVVGNANSSPVGGLAGYINAGSISTSYSTGMVSGPNGASIGGFDGDDLGAIESSYWDTDTSGTDEGSGDGNERGLTGLTTQELQSGLPSDFDPAIWAEDANINNGLPYLIANPPPS